MRTRSSDSRCVFNDGDYFRAIHRIQALPGPVSYRRAAGLVPLQVGFVLSAWQQWAMHGRPLTPCRAVLDPAVRAEAAYRREHPSSTTLCAGDCGFTACRRSANKLWWEPGAYLLGWSYLRGRQWPEASQTFEVITTTSPLFPSSACTGRGAREGEQLPRKSPARRGLCPQSFPESGTFIRADGAMDDCPAANALFSPPALKRVSAGNEAAAGVLLFFEQLVLGTIYWRRQRRAQV